MSKGVSMKASRLIPLILALGILAIMLHLRRRRIARLGESKPE